MTRILDAQETEEDVAIEGIRPTTIAEYIGQEELKRNLKIFIGAAKHRNEALDHVLLYGPPGLGKTTLAHVIANEMEGKIKSISGPAIEKSGDLAAILSTLEAGDVLFIDEIHRLPKAVEEVLYSAMEDFKLSIIIPTESGSNAINLDLPPFTLIGATTRAGNLTSPLRARFGISAKIDFYKKSEIGDIIKRTSRVLKTEIEDKAVEEIASRSRGTPRIANRLFRRVRDFVNYRNKDKISYVDAMSALTALKVDCIGLDDVDINYLLTLIKRFNGGPTGLDTIASAIGEETMNLEDVYEPYLLQIGFIDRTPRGRRAKESAYRHLEKYHHLKISR